MVSVAVMKCVANAIGDKTRESGFRERRKEKLSAICIAHRVRYESENKTWKSLSGDKINNDKLVCFTRAEKGRESRKIPSRARFHKNHNSNDSTFNLVFMIFMYLLILFRERRSDVKEVKKE